MIGVIPAETRPWIHPAGTSRETAESFQTGPAGSGRAADHGEPALPSPSPANVWALSPPARCMPDGWSTPWPLLLGPLCPGRRSVPVAFLFLLVRRTDLEAVENAGMTI
jgi:hypothetical protein